MVTYFWGCLLAISLAFASPALAQRATGTKLAALSLPDTKAASAAVVTAAPAAAAAPQFKPDSIFINPDVRPQFTGGDAAFQAYLEKNLRYPAEAMRQRITGKVMVTFVLSATGLVTYASVLRGPGNGLNEEALRLIWHMPPWQPARQRGQAVRVSCSIPVIFNL